MSAADDREEMEAAIWKAVTWAIRNADKPSSPRLEAHVKDALAKADVYALSLATEQIGKLNAASRDPGEPPGAVVRELTSAERRPS